MLLKRNLLESLTIISVSGTVICVLLNYVVNISPITGIWFPIYIFLLFIVSVLFSFKFLQWILHLNKPIKYDLDGLVKDYPYLSGLTRILPQLPKKLNQVCKEYDTNELSIITTVLERKLVSSWYVPYISQEIGFPFACKQMLDQMIGKCFQICNEIEPKEVYVDMFSVLITHLKEYRKALKRHEKSPSSAVESLYKKSHVISDCNKKFNSAEHCTNVLRIVLKELVPWELWDTPHSELLVRILSKKLDNFVDSTLADPAWLNEKLLSIVKGKEENIVVDDTETKQDVVIETKESEPKPVIEIPTVESALTTLITKTTAPILQRAINDEFNEESNIPETLNIVEEVPVTISEPVDIKSSPVMRQRRGRQGRNEVKIYDRIIEGSVKTWETDIDLQCISLGQDLLASLDGEITLSRLWGQEPEPEGSPNPPRTKSPQPLWFGEEDAIELDLADSPHKEQTPNATRKEHSPKATDALLKDLQTTVHQAKTKIGDLQDEAAGMMEGLLDFGIAGLKKGLRFTGLSDDLQVKSPHHKEKNAERVSPPEGGRSKHAPAPVEQREPIISSVIQKEDNGFNSVPPLLKQQRVISQDSVPRQPRELPPLLLSESPEPEYEEAADLSTSIAKLRHLLQRAETSPKTEDVWWEGTRSRDPTRPIDTATLADEYDMTAERNTSPGQTSNNMQRLDKLFQRTVTGVFNTIKTAVGAEGDAVPGVDHDWTYVPTSIELSVGGAVARLVGGRRARAHVDHALDSLQVAPPRPNVDVTPDDFEEWCALSGAAWCACADLCAAAALYRAHLAHSLATLLFADLAEALISVWLEDLSSWLRKQVFVVFEQMSEGGSDVTHKDKSTPKPLDVDHTTATIMQNMPSALYLFGEETLTKSVHLCVSSFSHKEVNRDVVFRLLDTFAVHFKKSASLRNPSFDAN